MKEIICPKCNTPFSISANEHKGIVSQIRDHEFLEQVEEKVKIIENDHALKYQIFKLNSENQNKEALNKLEKEHFLSKSHYESQLKDRDNTIDRLKNMKMQLSTKMIGETLEQHCEATFNQYRATGFQRAYFEKDNDIRAGSKGDFIFKDFDSDGNEIVSIMFDMKNESDTTRCKKKNEEFLKQLDKNRNDKNCEYAVLVSLLETESELYNSGIVDVSHRFPKMYVVRPQCFIQIITLLRNANSSAMEYKNELKLLKSQQLDITNFENDLNHFKSSFEKNFGIAGAKFEKAIDDLDKSINYLQKTRDLLVGTNRNLRLANDKAQNISIKKLTRDNPTMKTKFNQLHDQKSC